MVDTANHVLAEWLHDPIELTQAILALIMVGTSAYIVLSGGDLLPDWINLLLLVVGFYFGRSVGTKTNGNGK